MLLSKFLMHFINLLTVLLRHNSFAGIKKNCNGWDRSQTTKQSAWPSFGATLASGSVVELHRRLSIYLSIVCVCAKAADFLVDLFYLSILLDFSSSQVTCCNCEWMLLSNCPELPTLSTEHMYFWLSSVIFDDVGTITPQIIKYLLWLRNFLNGRIHHVQLMPLKYSFWTITTQS